MKSGIRRPRLTVGGNKLPAGRRTVNADTVLTRTQFAEEE